MKQVNVVTVPVISMKIVKPAKLTVAYVVNVMLAILQIAPIMIAVQRVGLVMDMQTVKTRLMAVILPAMTMMAVTAAEETIFLRVIKSARYIPTG